MPVCGGNNGCTCPPGNPNSYEAPMPLQLMHTSPPFFTFPTCQLIDINGDALVDIFCGNGVDGNTPSWLPRCVYINTGTGWRLENSTSISDAPAFAMPVKLEAALKSAGALRFRGLFIQHEIDEDTFGHMTDADLQAMGIHALGVRRRLLKDRRVS